MHVTVAAERVTCYLPSNRPCSSWEKVLTTYTIAYGCDFLCLEVKSSVLSQGARTHLQQALKLDLSHMLASRVLEPNYT